MKNKTSAKDLLQQLPVKMAAGGIIGNIGILNAASMRPTQSLTPEQKAYLDQFKAYEEQYNTQYLPAYQAFEPQYNAWQTGYNQAAEAINRGQYDRRLDQRSSGERTLTDRLQAQGWQVVAQGSNHLTLRPGRIENVYTVAEPRMSVEAPLAPAMPTGIATKLTPEQQKYLSEYSAYQKKYTQEYLPAYQAYAPAMAEWEKQYNQALADMNAGKYNLRVKRDSSSGVRLAESLGRQGWTVTASSNHYNISPNKVSQVFKTPAPTLSVARPTEPAVLPGYKTGEELQKAIAEQVQAEILAKQKQGSGIKKGLSIFANPAQYNLAGFAGSSTFNEPEPQPFFAKGGEVKQPSMDEKIAENVARGALGPRPVEGGLSYKDYPNPYGLRAYPKKDGYGGEMLPKYVGWAGEQEGRGKLQGSRVTEYSMEDEKGSFPIITPLLSREEIDLVASGIVTPSIYDKAVKWRNMQEEKGASAFLNPPGFKKGGDVKKKIDMLVAENVARGPRTTNKK